MATSKHPIRPSVYSENGSYYPRELTEADGKLYIIKDGSPVELNKHGKATLKDKNGNIIANIDSGADQDITIPEADATKYGLVKYNDTTTPNAGGTASVGISNSPARADHTHPIQTEVTGNAGTASKLKTARSITLSGAASSSAVEFDGSENIEIPVTTIDGTKITGVIPSSSIPESSKTTTFVYKGSRTMAKLEADVQAAITAGDKSNYAKGYFYTINDLTGYTLDGLSVGENIAFTGETVEAGDAAVTYDKTTETGNIHGLEFNRFITMDLSEYLKKTEAETAYASKTEISTINSDIATINAALSGAYRNGGNVDHIKVDLPVTDTSLINTMYNATNDNEYYGDSKEPGYHFRYKYMSLIQDIKITRNGDYYYIQIPVANIPSQCYYIDYHQTRCLYKRLDKIAIKPLAPASAEFEFTYEQTIHAESSDPALDEFRFSYSGCSGGPDLKEGSTLTEPNFVDNVWTVGDTNVAWRYSINADENFVITEDGIDVLSCDVTDYVSKTSFENLSETVNKKANQSDIDSINAALSGVYKNGGDVENMLISIPVSDDKINKMYNVIEGYWNKVLDYGNASPFRFEITIKNAYIYKNKESGVSSYGLYFTGADLPDEFVYTNEYNYLIAYGYDKLSSTMDYQPLSNWGINVLRFETPRIFTPISSRPKSDAIYKCPYKTSLSDSATVNEFFTTRVYTDYSDNDSRALLGDIKVILYRNDIKVDDNFVVTEHGFDILSYKLTDYVSQNDFKNLSNNVYKKAEVDNINADTKDKSMISTNESSQFIHVKKDALLSEPITKCNVYGTADGFACNSSSPYTVTVRCKNKNLFIMSNLGGESVRPFYSSDTYTYGGITYTKNPDGSITANGTSTANQNKIRYAASNLPPGYMYHISGCPSGGSDTTYFINTGVSRAGGDMGEGYDLDKTSATTFSSAYYCICIKKDAVLDNVVFKPQLEVGTVATEYVEGQESLVTAKIGSTTLGENDYVDIVNKVRYTNGAASNITVDGELKLFENGHIIVAPSTSATPSKVEVSYYKDINKVMADIGPNDGSAIKLQTARKIGLSGIEATAQDFDGTADINIPITAIPAEIVTGLSDAAKTGKYTDLSGIPDLATVATSGKYADLSGIPNIPIGGTLTPNLAGTAAVGTSEKWAREDHVHPAQSTITGNAGSATKLETARKISVGGEGVTSTAQDFNGTADITIPITAIPAEIVTGLSKVATSGNYSDLNGKPTIPEAGVSIPKSAGTGATGTATTYARADHVHPAQVISTSYTVAIPTTGWTGTTAPYTQTITVSGISASDSPVVDIIASDDYNTACDQITEYKKIYRITTASDSITVYASEKTEKDISVQLKCVK